MLQYGVDFSRLLATHLEPGGYCPEATSYFSSNLESVKSLLKKTVRPKILNLAPFDHGLFNYLSHLGPLLVNVDPEHYPTEEYIAKIESNAESFDLILLWDRLLYLSHSERKKLIACISKRSNEGASLLAYSSVRQFVPAKPSRFHLDIDSTVNFHPLTNDTIETCGYDLCRMMSGWKCSHSLQLRNSFREHLFVKI